MPHMLAQEHMAYVDALLHGTARTEATITAALSAIGSQPSVLILTYTGDGIWTIGTNTTIPSTVLLMVPPGVTISIASGVSLTLNCQIWAWRVGVFTGAGTPVYGATVTYSEIDFIQFRQIFSPVDGVPIQVGIPYAGSGIVTGRQVTTFTQNGANSVGFRFQVPPASGFGAQAVWDMGEDANARWFVQRSSAQPQLVLNDVGLGIVPGVSNPAGGNGAITPAYALHMLAATQAAQPGGGSWVNSTSDQRVKTIRGVFTEGLAKLKSLPRLVRYAFNGKGNTVDDGKEYVGYIAQELQPAAPEMVMNAYEVPLDEGGAPVMLLTTNLNNIQAIQTNAILELAARVEALEAPARQRAPQSEETRQSG